MDDLIVKDYLGQDYKFKISKKNRSHFTESIEFFDLKKNETRTVYFPYDELKATGLKFEKNSGNLGEYTLSLSNDLKLIEKTFKETKDLSCSFNLFW